MQNSVSVHFAREVILPVAHSLAPPRRRLSPEARRAAILDAAADLVSREGVSAASVERLSAECGVSKALIYAYFGNRNALLGEVLLREYPAFQQREPVPVDPEADLEEVVRRTTRGYLEHVAEKGILLQRLLAEPAIVATVSATRQLGREVTARQFAAMMVESHGIPLEKGIVVADILMGVTGAAGNLLFRKQIDREMLADMVVRIILAAVRSVGSQPAADAARRSRKS